MWSPTHVQITVSKARNLKIKGKLGTNDVYLTIKLGKEKYQTTVKERSKEPEWHERCEFPLSDENTTVKLNVFHRNLLGADDFLGYAELQVDQSQVYERPRGRWCTLKNKPGSKEPEKNRGELEVIVAFVVQSISESSVSLNKGVKKHSSMKNFANRVGDRLHIKRKSKDNIMFGGRSDISISGLHNTQQRKLLSASYFDICQENIEKNCQLEPLETDEIDDEVEPQEISVNRISVNAAESDAKEESFAESAALDETLQDMKVKTEEHPNKETSEVADRPDTICELQPEVHYEFDDNLQSTKSEMELSHQSPDQNRQINEICEVSEAVSNFDKVINQLEANDASNNSSNNSSTQGNTETIITSTENNLSSDYDVTSNKTDKIVELLEVAPSCSEPTNQMLLSCDELEYDCIIQALSPKEDLTPGNTKAIDSDHKIPPKNMKIERTSSESSGCHFNAQQPESNNNISTTVSKQSVVSKEWNKQTDAPRGRSKYEENRHTLHFGDREKYRISLFELQEIEEYKRNKQSEQHLSQLCKADFHKFENFSKEDLILLIQDQQKQLQKKDSQIAELENYIDNLLVKVIEIQPQILTAELSSFNNFNLSKQSRGPAKQGKPEEQSGKIKLFFNNPLKALQTALN